jgi:hypothetical protein
MLTTNILCGFSGTCEPIIVPVPDILIQIIYGPWPAWLVCERMPFLCGM